MTTRREVLEHAVRIAGMSALAAWPWFGMRPAFAQGGTARLSAAQRDLALDVSVGSLVGAGLGEQVYVDYARAAPRQLVATFAEHVGGPAGRPGTGNLARPSREYIDFRVATAANDMPQAATALGRDVGADTAAFQLLGNAVVQQTKLIGDIRQAPGTSLRDLRDQLQVLRQEVEIVRLEQSCASKSTSVYRVTQDEVENSRVEQSGQVRRQIEACMKQATALEVRCRELAEAVTRGR